MRRLILSGVFAVVAFGLGVGLTLHSYRYCPPKVSLCELARHPGWYDQKVIRVRAYASGLNEGVIISEAECAEVDAVAVVVPDESYHPSPEVETFFMSSSPQIRRADVLVVGRFDRNATPGCFGPRLGIHATSIELKSHVSIEPFRRRGG